LNEKKLIDQQKSNGRKLEKGLSGKDSKAINSNKSKNYSKDQPASLSFSQ
jgi:hypothetical protein